MTDTIGALRLHAGRAVVTLTVALASFGVLSPVAGAARHHSSGRVTHHQTTHHHSGSCIPQHNGGDRDADNRGGPSDGDGCL